MNSTQTAQTVISALAGAVTDFVICPGSRSAPLTIAASQCRTHVRIDERSAGFFALGLAKALADRLPAVIVTSGTAVGNLLPAVLEAHHSHIPMILLTADRPAELVGTGANQTTTQVGMFSEFVRACIRIPAELPADEIRRRVADGLALAVAFDAPGPVQFNVELREPLVADPPVIPGLAEVVPTEPARPIDAISSDEKRRPSTELEVAEAGEPIALGRFPVVVAGDGDPATGRAAAAFAAAVQAPLIAEPSSGARSFALTFGAELAATELAAAVDCAIVFGHPTLHRAVHRLLARPEVAVTVVSPFAQYPNPGWGATAVKVAATASVSSPGWLAKWQAGDDELAAIGPAATGSAATGSATGPAATGPISGVELAVAIAESCPDRLVVGPSNPVRDLCHTPMAANTICLANRGLAGIDGIVSTAFGVATAAGPTTLYCGDVTFVHDSNGLQMGLDEPRPDLRIVVANDHGGSIFATLEYGQPAFEPVFERFFATDPGVDLVSLARAYGVPARAIETRDELRSALSEPFSGTSVLVVSIARDRQQKG